MTEQIDLIVPAEAAQRVVRYKRGDFARCADEIGDALIELEAPICVRGERLKRRPYWRDDAYVHWPLNNRSLPPLAVQIGLRCERWNERLGCYEGAGLRGRGARGGGTIALSEMAGKVHGRLPRKVGSLTFPRMARNVGKANFGSN